ncbi:hypothetical protein [Sphingobacterium siyangense]|jgi:hypothetical protein|uniref:hypothetical protein n=1 Tax=Sphingobacterium siyangense TaxID=459529 RepID=UPI003C749BEC
MKDLTGLIVMAHLDLRSHDPQRVQGETGIIIGAVEDETASLVSFRDRLEICDNDKLYMLMPTEVAKHSLENSRDTLDLDLADILEINIITGLVEDRQPEEFETALKLACGNPKIFETMVFSVQDWFDYQQKTGRGR